LRRLLRLMTRRYRSLRSEVAKRPPSSGTSGRSSGGSTGSTVRIIHSGGCRSLRSDSISLRRLDSFLILVSELVSISSRIWRISTSRSMVLQQVLHGLGAHASRRTRRRTPPAPPVLLVGEQLAALEVGHAGVDDDEGLEVEHALDVAQGHVQQQADARRQRLQEPDVRHGAGQVDMAHALTAHLGQRDLDAALLADHAAVLEALVLAAQALVVADRAEDLGAEQAVALRLEGAVVDGLGLLDLAVGPGADHVR
jgi:hypothetical protein